MVPQPKTYRYEELVVAWEGSKNFVIRSVLSRLVNGFFQEL